MPNGGWQAWTLPGGRGEARRKVAVPLVRCIIPVIFRDTLLGGYLNLSEITFSIVIKTTHIVQILHIFHQGSPHQV
jgi:hypothetical protein